MGSRPAISAQPSSQSQSINGDPSRDLWIKTSSVMAASNGHRRRHFPEAVEELFLDEISSYDSAVGSERRGKWGRGGDAETKGNGKTNVALRLKSNCNQWCKGSHQIGHQRVPTPKKKNKKKRQGRAKSIHHRVRLTSKVATGHRRSETQKEKGESK